MEEAQKNLTLIDLISEQHGELRRETERRWTEIHGGEVSRAETHLMSLLEHGSLSMAECGRRMHITRQAVHKCVQGLIDTGYVALETTEDNRRDRLMVLTDAGKVFCEEMQAIKLQIEGEIARRMGAEAVDALKVLMRRNLLA